jgi:hypothetical protein
VQGPSAPAPAASEIGIDRAEVIPGGLDAFDIDDLTRLICPRPLGIFAGDPTATHTTRKPTREHYRATNHEDRLHCDITTGGHALTPQRSRSIKDWVVRIASST